MLIKLKSAFSYSFPEIAGPDLWDVDNFGKAEEESDRNGS